MWEDLKSYKLLDKKDINSTFKQFGKVLLSHVNGYAIEQTNSLIKLSRQINHLEQSIFIEKQAGSYELKVRTCIKPIDFYRKHQFTMINIVPLGDILNNYRRTFYPLSKEWNDLALFIATRIKNEIESHFQKYDTYDKIIERRQGIEPNDSGSDNKYELLIYAAIRTKNKSLLISYLDKKISTPVMQITQSELLKPDPLEINESDFLKRIKTFAEEGDFASIEDEIASISKIQ